MENTEKKIFLDALPVSTLHEVYREVATELELRDNPKKLAIVLYRIAKAMLELQVAVNTGDSSVDMRDEALMLYAIAEVFENA